MLGFLGVLLLGFSDLLILFLGFVGFFVQIGLLDLGIRLDSKKITLYSAICDSRFVQIFGLVILGWGPRGRSRLREKICLINGPGPGHRSGPSMKKPGPNPTRCHS